MASFGTKGESLFRYPKLEPVSVPKTGTCFGTQNWNLFRYPKLEPVSVSKTGTYFGTQNWNLFRHPKLEPVSGPKTGTDFVTKNETCFGTKNCNLSRHHKLELGAKIEADFGTRNCNQICNNFVRRYFVVQEELHSLSRRVLFGAARSPTPQAASAAISIGRACSGFHLPRVARCCAAHVHPRPRLSNNCCRHQRRA